MSDDLFRSPSPSAPNDPDAERRALVALSLVPGVGSGRLGALVGAFGTAEDVLRARPHALAAVPGVGPETARSVAAFDGWIEVDRQMARAERAGATLVTRWDDGYPARLQEIYDAPALLWVRGALTDADHRAVAVVGTRRASDYGRRVAHAFARGLAERGWTVVSGLAYGIDAAAHQGALDGGGRTVAVLGSGVDRVYPARHAHLADEIVERGALVSELALGAAPDAPNFPRRNRIVSGLAAGTLVAEAFEEGGALITARLAIEHNREVFAVPAPFDSETGRGCNRLIQRGEAKLVLTVDDVLEELGEAPAARASAARAPGAAAPDLGPVEGKLYAALTATPVHLDALCTATGYDASTALVYLLGLEFRGLVRQLAGKQFLRA